VRERATAALPRDTQDIMSFIYQFSLAPPAPGRYRVPITTGAKFETYDIEVRAEESIETPLGTMRTIPVSSNGGRAPRASRSGWLRNIAICREDPLLRSRGQTRRRTGCERHPGERRLRARMKAGRRKKESRRTDVSARDVLPPSAFRLPP
jgi:hypothetical protein